MLKTGRRRMIEQLALIQPLQTPQVDYLTDLKPLGYRHVPFLSARWPQFGSDASVRDGLLRAAGGRYAKGLAMHSASRVAFVLTDAYRRLEAELAVDEIVGETGSVVFRVYVDKGDGRFRSAYASPIVRGGQEPLAMSVDVEGVKRLALLVDFADRGDAGDHADWLNARLIK